MEKILQKLRSNVKVRNAASNTKKKTKEEKYKEWDNESAYDRTRRILAEGRGPQKVGSDPDEARWYAERKKGAASAAAAKGILESAAAQLDKKSVDMGKRMREAAKNAQNQSLSKDLRRQHESTFKKLDEEQKRVDRKVTGLYDVLEKGDMSGYAQDNKWWNDRVLQMDTLQAKANAPEKSTTMTPEKARQEQPKMITAQDAAMAGKRTEAWNVEETAARRMRELTEKKTLTGEEKEELAGLGSQWGYTAQAHGGLDGWLRAIEDGKGEQAQIAQDYKEQQAGRDMSLVEAEDANTAQKRLEQWETDEESIRRMRELEGKDSLTVEEEGELTDLKRQYAELEAYAQDKGGLEAVVEAEKADAQKTLDGSFDIRQERRDRIEGKLPDYETEMAVYNGFEAGEYEAALEQQNFENDMLMKLYQARNMGMQATPKGMMDKPMNINAMIAQLEQSTIERQEKFRQDYDNWKTRTVQGIADNESQTAYWNNERRKAEAANDGAAIKAIDKRIEELKQDSVARNDAILQMNPDFAQNAQPRMEFAAEDPNYWLINWDAMTDMDPTMNPYGYRGDETKEQLYERLLAMDASYDPKMFYLLGYEKDTYNYKYFYDRMNGTDTAGEYLKRIDNRLTKRMHDYNAKRAYELGKQSPSMALVANVLLMPLDMMGIAQTNLNAMIGRDTNPYGGAFAPFVARTMGTQGGADVYERDIDKGVYNLIKGMSEVGTAFLMGPAGKYLMPAAAGTAQAYDTLKRGGSSFEGALEGDVASALEWFTEGTFDRITDMIKMGKATGQTWEQVARKVLGDFVGEYAEEIPGNLATTLFDRWLMGADSAWEEEKKETGKSNKEMWDQLLQDMNAESTMAGLTGVALGGIGYASSKRQASKIAGDIMDKMPDMPEELAKSVAEQMVGIKEAIPEEMEQFAVLAEESQALAEVSDPFQAPALVKGMETQTGQLPVTDVTGLDRIQGEKAYVTLQNGQTVDLDSVTFDDLDTRDAYRAAVKQPDVEAARAFLSSWQESGLPVSVFERAFNDAFDQGRRMGGSYGPSALNQTARRTAYQAGQKFQKNVEAVLDTPKEVAGAIQERIAAMPRTLEEGFKGGVVMATRSARLNPTQAVQAALLDEYGKRHGVSYVVVDTIKGGKANGLYKDGVIYVAADAVEGNLTRGATHEGWHYLKESLGAEHKGIKAMENLVLSVLQKEKGYSLETRIEQVKNAYKEEFDQDLDDDAALEEIVADSLFDVFSTKENLEALIKTDGTVAEKFVSWVKRFRKQMREAMRRIRMRSPEARAMFDSEREWNKMGISIADNIIESYNILMKEAKESKRKTQPMEMKEAASGKYQAKLEYITESTEKGNEKYSLQSEQNDAVYMDAVKRGDMDEAQRMVDEAAEARLKGSKLRTSDGKLRKVYHGTNSPDFNTFDPDYIGAASGDDGFFGMGFYFAYTKGEASYYGARRIISAYLNIENPFNHQKELSLYNGERALYGSAPDAVRLMNFTEKFPDIASKITIAVDKGSEEGFTRITAKEFADAFKKVIDEKEFKYQTINGRYGDETLVTADEGYVEYEDDGVKGRYFDIGFQYKAIGKIGKIDVAYEYLSNNVYKYIDMPNFTRVILDNNREYTNELKRMGYDGVIQSEEGDEAVAFYPNQIKSAEPVTYDDNGEVIPLSERFSNDDDIRYSLQDTRAENMDEALMENAELKKSLETMRRLFAENREEIVNDPKAIRQVAKQLIDQTQSQYSEALLSKNLRDIYNGLSNARWDTDYQKAMQDLVDLSKAVIEKSVRMDNNLAEEYADLRKELRTTNISLTESQIAEAAKLYGSYEDFRRQYMGRLRLTKPENGIDLTSKWQEMSEQYPEFFPADTNEGDMISRLADVVEALKPTYSNIYGQNMGEAAYDLAMDMWQGFLEVPQLTSQQKKTIVQLKNDLAELQREHRDTTWKFKQMSQKYAEQENRIANMARQRQLNQEKLQAKAEITRIVKSLSKQLLKPTNQQHIPKRMRGVTAELLATIDFKTNMTGEKVSRILEDLHTQYLAAAVEADNDETNEGYTFDPDVADLMESAAKITRDGKKPLSEMGLEELQTVRDALRAMRHIVAEANELFVDAKKRTATAAGDDTIATLNSWRGKNESRFAVIRAAGDMLQRGLIKPTYFFEQLKGTPLYDAWVNIRKGEAQHTRQVEQAENYLRGVMKDTKYDPKTWKLEEELKFSDEWRLMEEAKGKEAKRPMLVMSRGELMMLYATAKREKNTGTQHLEKGGVEFESQRYAKKEKNARFQLDYDTVMSLAEANLTKEQRAYVDRLVEYLSTVCAAQGNVVSNRMYGIDKFKEKYYVPFKTAGNYLKSDPAAGVDSRLSTGSFTKNLTEKARTPLTIRDFTEVWCEHVEKMSAYAAFALPLEDFNRIYNNKGTKDENAPSDQSVKASIAYALGQRGKGYIDVFLKDLNGNNRNPLGSATMLNTLTSKAKGVSIGFNLSVAVQQMSAAPRAMAMIDAKYMAAGMVKGLNYKKSFEEMKKWAPIALQKEWGYFDTNMARSLYDRMDQGWRKKLDDAAGWLPQQGDRINWAQMWEAVKMETADKTDYAPGTEEFFKAAGERITDVIDHTQVADSVFQRAEWARSKDGLTKALVSFMSEPITQYNMLWDAANKFARAKGMEKGAARTQLISSGRKAVRAVATSMILNSALQALAAALRDRENEKKVKDEDGNTVTVGVRTYGDKWTDAFIDNMISAPLSMLPFVSDAVSMIEGFDPSRMDMQVLSKLVKAGTYWWDVLSGKKELDAWKGIYTVADAISYATGVPVSNLMRDGYAAYQTGYEALTADLLPGTAWDKAQGIDARLKAAEANYTAKKGDGDARKLDSGIYYDLLLKAWYEGGAESEEFKAVLDAMTKQGVKGQTIYTNLKKRLSETEPLVSEGANALAANDLDAYEKAYTALMEKGYTMNMALEMIKSAAPKEEAAAPNPADELEAVMGKLRGGEKKTGAAATAYGYGDLISALESGNTKNRDVVLNAFEEAGVKESTIRSQVTGEYRKRWLEAENGGDKAEANRIKKLLKESGLDYDDEDFENWWTDDAYDRLYEQIDAGEMNDAQKTRQSIVTRTKDDSASWSRITSYYAKKYKDLYKRDYNGAMKLKSKLIQLGMYESTIAKWEKQAKKTK